MLEAATVVNPKHIGICNVFNYDETLVSYHVDCIPGFERQSIGLAAVASGPLECLSNARYVACKASNSYFL